MSEEREKKQVLRAPCTLENIADAYGVSSQTMRNWMRIGGVFEGKRKRGRVYYLGYELERIFAVLGEPEMRSDV